MPIDGSSSSATYALSPMPMWAQTWVSTWTRNRANAVLHQNLRPQVWLRGHLTFKDYYTGRAHWTLCPSTFLISPMPTWSQTWVSTWTPNSANTVLHQRPQVWRCTSYPSFQEYTCRAHWAFFEQYYLCLRCQRELRRGSLREPQTEQTLKYCTTP